MDIQHNDTQHNDMQHNSKQYVILNKMTLSIMAEHCYAECHLCCISLKLSATYNHFMLSVIVLNVTYWVTFSTMSLILSVTYKHFMLSVIVLNVVAPQSVHHEVLHLGELLPCPNSNSCQPKHSSLLHKSFNNIRYWSYYIWCYLSISAIS
jgi:hypothetical protein